MHFVLFTLTVSCMETVGRVFTNGKVRAAITALFFDFIAANGENPSVHRKHVQTENEAFG